MAHANAALTPRARLRLARLIVDDGCPVARAAQRFQVAWPTAKRWADRYRQHGPEGMHDRTSRPHHSPRRTPQPIVRKIVHLRWKQRLGPVGIAGGCVDAFGDSGADGGVDGPAAGPRGGSRLVSVEAASSGCRAMVSLPASRGPGRLPDHNLSLEYWA